MIGTNKAPHNDGTKRSARTGILGSYSTFLKNIFLNLVNKKVYFTLSNCGKIVCIIAVIARQIGT